MKKSAEIFISGHSGAQNLLKLSKSDNFDIDKLVLRDYLYIRNYPNRTI
jgi:hypothetical protein